MKPLVELLEVIVLAAVLTLLIFQNNPGFWARVQAIVAKECR